MVITHLHSGRTKLLQTSDWKHSYQNVHGPGQEGSLRQTESGLDTYRKFFHNTEGIFVMSHHVNIWRKTTCWPTKYRQINQPKLKIKSWPQCLISAIVLQYNEHVQSMSLLLNSKCWSLTEYCPKLRLCLKRRKQRTAEMTVWARVKRRRDDFTPLLTLCWKRHHTQHLR